MTRPRVAPTAAWRVAPDAAERLSVKPQENLWQRIFAWIFLLCGLGFFFIIARQEVSPEGRLGSHLKAFLMMGICQAILIWLITEQSNWVGPFFGMKRLRFKLPNEEATPVAIQIRQLGTVTGQDQGCVWIDDGTLFYKGLQCVFRLNAEDLRPLEQWPRRQKPDMGKGRMPNWLPIRAGERDMELSLRLVDPFEDFNTRRRAHRFQTRLTQWIYRRPEGSLEGLLPPKELHPSLFRTDPLRREGVITGLGLMAVNSILILSAIMQAGKGDSFLTLLQWVFGIGMGLWAARFAWQQHCDLVQRRSIFEADQAASPLG